MRATLRAWTLDTPSAEVLELKSWLEKAKGVFVQNEVDPSSVSYDFIGYAGLSKGFGASTGYHVSFSLSGRIAEVGWTCISG